MTVGRLVAIHALRLVSDAAAVEAGCARGSVREEGVHGGFKKRKK